VVKKRGIKFNKINENPKMTWISRADQQPHISASSRGGRNPFSLPGAFGGAATFDKGSGQPATVSPWLAGCAQQLPSKPPLVTVRHWHVLAQGNSAVRWVFLSSLRPEYVFIFYAAYA